MDPKIMSHRASVLLVDDDPQLRDSVSLLLATAHLQTKCFSSAEDFLRSEDAQQPACLLLDVRLPGMSGLELLNRLIETGLRHVVVVITGHGDVPMAVTAMRAGAFHFAEKPFDPDAFLSIVSEALERVERLADTLEQSRVAAERYCSLSAREREVLDLLVEGRPSKLIAYDLGISTRTAEHHRSAVMRKMSAKSLSHLVRMALDLRRPRETSAQARRAR
jgi:two-component system response regulator FixJ